MNKIFKIIKDNFPFVSKDNFDDINERNAEILHRISVVRSEKHNIQAELEVEKAINDDFLETTASLRKELFRYQYVAVPLCLLIGCVIGYWIR